MISHDSYKKGNEMVSFTSSNLRNMLTRVHKGYNPGPQRSACKKEREERKSNKVEQIFRTRA